MSSPEKERGSGAPIPLGTSPVKDEGREEIEDALEVESEVEKTPRIRLEVPADFADRADTEMEKRADGADASVLIFSLCCANFLAVNGKIAKTFDFSTVLFFA